MYIVKLCTFHIINNQFHKGLNIFSLLFKSPDNDKPICIICQILAHGVYDLAIDF